MATIKDMHIATAPNMCRQWYVCAKTIGIAPVGRRRGQLVFQYGTIQLVKISLFNKFNLKNSNLKIHLIGKLQSNKIKDALKIFSYIHSLDSKKLAILLDKEQNKKLINIKYFVQVNLGNENQKSGIMLDDLDDFINFCRLNTNLDIIGLMCIPPINESSDFYFRKLSEAAKKNNLYELSMGMSNDYISGINNGSTFLRIGSAIFGERAN
jgi:pyridoxal phosphate enzyme (YggS family)